MVKMPTLINLHVNWAAAEKQTSTGGLVGAAGKMKNKRQMGLNWGFGLALNFLEKVHNFLDHQPKQKSVDQNQGHIVQLGIKAEHLIDLHPPPHHPRIF